MYFDSWSPVLDELHKQRQVSELTHISNDQLDLFEDLEDIDQEKLSPICRCLLLKSGNVRK